MEEEPDISSMTPEEIIEYQKKNCVFCKIIRNEIPAMKVYEDDKVCCILDINPVTEGHLLILTKEHFHIMPSVPDEIASHMIIVAKKMSQAALQGLDAKGTNVFLAIGQVAGQKAPHVMLYLIPRKDGDGFELAIPKNKITDDNLLKMKEVLLKKIAPQLGIAEQQEQAQQQAPPPENQDKKDGKQEEAEKTPKQKTKEKEAGKPAKKEEKQKAAEKQRSAPNLDDISRLFG